MKLNWRSLSKRLVGRLIVAGVVCLALAALPIIVVSSRLSSIFEAREQPVVSRVLGRAYPLREGIPGSARELSVRFDRLGYRRVTGHPADAGSYSFAGGTVEASLRGFHDLAGDHPAQTVKVAFSGGRIVDVSSPNALLEPETLAAFQGGNLEDREIIQIADCPKQLIEAILAAEDRRFFIHPGIDPGGIARAVWSDLTSKSLSQGGSTLTQQLAKNLYFSGERTFTRKAEEAFAALVLEVRYPKERILRAYINEIYLGQRGATSILGFGRGARHYFGKSVRDLTLPESALIAGLIRAPGLYNPWLHPERARERRDAILRAMQEMGVITEAQRKEAENSPLRVRRPDAHQATSRNSYTAELIRLDLEAKYGEDFWRRGILVHTSIDPLYQEAAEQAVSSHLAQLERTYRYLRPGRNGRSLQAALISVDLADGSILAMVGGRDFGASQFNRSLSAKRQPGSLFKPVVYLAGLTSTGEPSADDGDDRRPPKPTERQSDDQIVRAPGSDGGDPFATIDAGILLYPRVPGAAVGAGTFLVPGVSDAALHGPGIGKTWRIEPARWRRSREKNDAAETRPKKKHRFHWFWQKRDEEDEPDQDANTQAPAEPPEEPREEIPEPRDENVPSLPFTAATVLMDEPYEILAGGKIWAPQNDDETFRGPVTVQRALEESLNVPTARAAAVIGLPRIVETGRALGITSPLPAVPSLALGAADITPMEMATAFSTIASGGRRRDLGFLLGVEDPGRGAGKAPGPNGAGSPEVQAVPEAEAHLMTALLEGVLDHGTGASARGLGFGGVAAGKTGTSDDGRDLWFCGYTPKVLTLVWVGYDDNSPTHLTGARGALPIWVDYMEQIGADSHFPFNGDSELVWEKIDPATGGIAVGRCPEERLAPFLPGTEPTEECSEHRSFWSRWFE